MNTKMLLTDFIVTGLIVLLTSLIVTYIYTLIAYGAGALDWEASIRLAIIFAIALPLVRRLDKKKAA